MEDSQDECEGNKDATHALMLVKQKLYGYDEGEMRNVRGQVISNINACSHVLIYTLCLLPNSV